MGDLGTRPPGKGETPRDPAVAAWYANEGFSASRLASGDEPDLRRVERLSALGQMAGSVAHDFNNLLAAIMGTAELLADELPAGPAKNRAELIAQTAEDAAAVARRVQEFATQDFADDVAAVDVAELFHSVAELTRPRWKHEAERNGISITLSQKANGVPPVLGRARELREALVNLVFNAVEALPEGGRITLSAHLEEERILLCVADDGIGMSAEARENAFRAFYSTKGTRGTGLGLSVVRSIVQAHGGTIDLETAPGRGTRVLIHLPAADRNAVIPEPNQVARQVVGRLLLVEDDRAVAEVLAEALESAGHQVEVLSDGRSAAERLARGGLDALLTDLGMPGMSGWEVAQRAFSHAPEMPVLILTGWSSDSVTTSLVPPNVARVLAKPVRIEELLAAVEEVLRTPSQDRPAA